MSGNPHSWSGPDGWAYGGACARIGDPNFLQASFNGIEHCILGNVQGVALGTPIPDTDISFHLGAQHGSKMEGREWWHRNAGELPGSIPEFPGHDRTPVPTSPIDPWKKRDPMDVPLQPQPQVVPDPYPVNPYPSIQPRHWRSPTERTFAGPDIRRVPRRTIIIIVNPRGLPVRQPKPKEPKRKPRRIPPWVIPTVDIVIEPQPEKDQDPRRDRPPAPRPDLVPLRPPLIVPGHHEPKPPGPRTRETKSKMRTPFAFAIVRALFEQVFEGIDYVDAIYDSLPDNVKAWYKRYHGVNSRTPWDKLRVIWKHHDLISVSEMINNLIANEIEDLAFGTLGRISQLVARRLNLSVGPGFGQGSLRKHAQTIAAELERMKDEITFAASAQETFR